MEDPSVLSTGSEIGGAILSSHGLAALAREALPWETKVALHDYMTLIFRSIGLQDIFSS
jgi:hypothetical protein